MPAQSNHSVWTGYLSATTGTVAVGYAMIPDEDGEHYVVATSAARTAAARVDCVSGITITAGDDSNRAVEIQVVGPCPQSITGLTPGAAAELRVSPAGRLERIVGPAAVGDIVVGKCDADGFAYLNCSGVRGSTGAAGADGAEFEPPTGTGFAHVTGGVLDATATAAARYVAGQIQIDAALQFKNGSILGDLEWEPTSTDKTLTLPDATDTVVARDTTDTLTNKTLASPIVTGQVLYQGDDWAIKSVIGKVQTASTAAATVADYAMSDESGAQFDAIVTCTRRTAVTKAGTFKLGVSYRRTGGAGPTIVGALVQQTAQELTAGAVTINVSVNTVRVRVTSTDADPRTWTCELRVQETLAT